MGGLEMPLMLITHCALMVIYVDCWTWKRCWGVNEGEIVFGKNTHWLLGDHPCKLFFSQPTPVISENKRISKKWAKSCWNNAGDHYNVFFPHPKPTSTSAERERLTFKRIGQNRLNTHWWSLQYALLPVSIIGYIWKDMYLGGIRLIFALFALLAVCEMYLMSER